MAKESRLAAEAELAAKAGVKLDAMVARHKEEVVAAPKGVLKAKRSVRAAEILLNSRAKAASSAGAGDQPAGAGWSQNQDDAESTMKKMLQAEIAASEARKNEPANDDAPKWGAAKKKYPTHGPPCSWSQPGFFEAAPVTASSKYF